jgi:steroid delta-isomerase-like uncharacterized protein
MKNRFLILTVMVAVGFAVAAQEKDKGAGDEFIKQAFAAWNAHDADKVVQFYTPDIVYEDVAYGAVSHGAAELRKFAAGLFEAVPDLRLEAVNSAIRDGHGVVEWILSGTDKGLFNTGKKFSVRGVSIFEMRAGKCSSNKDFYDLATIMRQVGELPAKPAAAQ